MSETREGYALPEKKQENKEIVEYVVEATLIKEDEEIFTNESCESYEDPLQALKVTLLKLIELRPQEGYRYDLKLCMQVRSLNGKIVRHCIIKQYDVRPYRIITII
jgi:hypothetical protein